MGPIEIEGVVVRGRGQPARVETLLLDPPGPGEVLVRMLASGVCHSDLHYKLGALGGDFPYLLGHEGAGVVTAVGERVSSPQVGDYVALTYRAPCGQCRFCSSGRLERCCSPAAAGSRVRTMDGLFPQRALDLGTHATYAVLAAGQAIPVPRECPPELACLIGCGVSTGVGAVRSTAGVTQGSTVAVIGCGGVGCNVIQGARLVQASSIIAVDVSDQKLKWAEEFGATHTVHAGRTDPVQRIKQLTDGNGVNYAFDAVGSPLTTRQCIDALDYKGTAILIGVPGQHETLELPLQGFFFLGATFRVSLGGDVLPSRDFPELVDWHLRGELDLDKLVSRLIALSDIEAAFGAMARGEVLRSVVRFKD